MVPAPSLALDTWLDTGLKGEEAPSVPSGSLVALHVFRRLVTISRWLSRDILANTGLSQESFTNENRSEHPCFFPLSSSLHLFPTPLFLPNVHRHSSNKDSHPSLGTVSRSAGPCTTRHGRWGARPHAARISAAGPVCSPQGCWELIVHLNQFRLKDGVSASCFSFKCTLAVLTGLHSPVVAEILASKVRRAPTTRARHSQPGRVSRKERETGRSRVCTRAPC